MKDIHEIWTSIEEQSQTSASSYTLLKIHPFGLRIGIDNSRQQRVLIAEISPDHKVSKKNVPNWRGVEVYFRTQFLSLEKVLILYLVDIEQIDIFNSLIMDLESSYSRSNNREQATGIFFTCLRRWQQFFQNYGTGILGREARQGLYGELYFLRNHLLRHRLDVRYLDNWRGHDRKYHDFSFPGGNVEVKTCSQKEHRKVFINSEMQLNESLLPSLYLYVLCMRTSDQHGESLEEIAQSVLSMLSADDEAVIVFKQYLSQAGYLEAHAEYYKSDKYLVDKGILYQVRDDFPRIIELPPGIGDIKYSIMLDTCHDYTCDIDQVMANLRGQ